MQRKPSALCQITRTISSSLIVGTFGRVSESCVNVSVFIIIPSSKLRAINRKIQFVKKSGGKCSECGYNKNLAALCFHHINDDDSKEFGLDMRQFSNRSIETLETELKKCILLCANCHMETHYPILNEWWEHLDSNQGPDDYSSDIKLSNIEP